MRFYINMSAVERESYLNGVALLLRPEVLRHPLEIIKCIIAIPIAITITIFKRKSAQYTNTATAVTTTITAATTYTTNTILSTKRNVTRILPKIKAPNHYSNIATYVYHLADIRWPQALICFLFVFFFFVFFFFFFFFFFCCCCFFVFFFFFFGFIIYCGFIQLIQKTS